MDLVFPFNCSVVVTGLWLLVSMALCAFSVSNDTKAGKDGCLFCPNRKWTFEHLFCNHSMKLMSGLFEVQKVTTVIEMSDKSALPLSQRPPLFFCF